MMEQLIRLIKYDSGNDLIKLLDELWVVYKTISVCRYIAVRGITARRHIHHGIGGVSIDLGKFD